uniref:Granulins domain-containing protein n=1 Tax=Plectus sambesii TaxID=2011161 RepID=A0A914WDR3_9BILA
MSHCRKLPLLLLLIPVCLSQTYCTNDAQCPLGQTCMQVGQPDGGVNY